MKGKCGDREKAKERGNGNKGAMHFNMYMLRKPEYLLYTNISHCMLKYVSV